MIRLTTDESVVSCGRPRKGGVIASCDPPPFFVESLFQEPPSRRPRVGEVVKDLGVFTEHLCDEAPTCAHARECMRQPVGVGAVCLRKQHTKRAPRGAPR